MDELRPCLGDAGALSAGLSLVVMMCFPGRVRGSHCAGIGCSAFFGEGFPSKLGGAADPESVGSIPVGFYRPTLASGRPAPGLFSQGCQILSLSRREGPGAASFASLGRPGPGTQKKQQFPPRQMACPLSRLYRGHRDIAHQLQGSHNSFKTITLFI